MQKRDRLRPDDEYIAVTVSSCPAGRNEEIVWDYSQKRFQILSLSLVDILRVADRFRTASGHRDALLQAGWQDDGSGFIADAFAELIDRRLLRSKSDFISKLVADAKPLENPAPISSLGWVTRDRPSLLKRGLDSFVGNCGVYDRRVLYKIFDDSADRQTQRSVRQMLSSLAQQKNVQIAYAGEEEKSHFTDQLISATGCEGLPREVLEFALADPFNIGFTAGANYNSFLLGTVGELAAVVDDDIVCKPALPPNPADGLEICSSPDPSQFRFFNNRAALLESVTDMECNILACHEQLLGRSVADTLRSQTSSERIYCSRLTSSYLRLLEAGSGKVLVTMTGVYGDSGMGSPRMLLGLTGGNREALLRSEDHYRSAFRSREVLRAVPRPTLSFGAFLMTMNSGFDNRVLLPPFFPVLRNCDGLFAQVLRVCRPESMIGHCPAGLYHDPEEHRTFLYDKAVGTEIRMTDLLILLISDFQPKPGYKTAEAHLQNLGRYLSEIACLKPIEFSELLTRVWVAEMSRYSENLDYLLAAYHGEPSFWAEDVEKYRHSILDRILSADTTITPDDLRVRLGDSDAAGACRELIGAYGRLLTWWPLIVNTARTLQSRGIALAVSV